MATTIVIALPAVPDVADATAHWWTVANDGVVAHGAGDGWRDALTETAGPPPRVVAIAPASTTRIAIARIADAAPRQAAGIARVAAVDASLGDRETLHAVASVPTEQGGAIATAIVANAAMVDWIDWCAAHGCDPATIVPAALIVPRGDGWAMGAIGAETVVTRGDAMFVDDPALASALIGQDDVATIAADAIDAAIAAAAVAPPIDLRSGRFARRRRIFLDRERIRELAVIAAFIPLVALLLAIVAIVRLNAAADRIDAQAVAAASALLGSPVTIATAEGELDQRAARTAGAGGRLTGPLAVLYTRLQNEPTVKITALGWRGEGTLSTTLAAPRIDEINRVLIALQERDGFTVTAVPRQSTDGRAMADITMRATP